MTISNNKVVSVSYELLVDGAKVDSADESAPISFLFGVGQMIPGFEKKLEGLKQGDDYAFIIESADGYGEINADAVVDLDKQVFMKDGEFMVEVAVGATLPMQDQNDNKLEGRVMEVGEATVKLDFNHPLAGKSLDFSGKVIEVREATAEEVDHGHVHGPGGHHH